MDTINSLPDLVIFDCDGVLVDSEIIANGVMAECLNEAGVMLNVEQTMAFGVGKSATAVAAAVKTEFGITLPANFFEDMGVRIIAAYDALGLVIGLECAHGYVRYEGAVGVQLGREHPRIEIRRVSAHRRCSESHEGRVPSAPPPVFIQSNPAMRSTPR
jgi:hypothetical protein